MILFFFSFDINDFFNGKWATKATAWATANCSDPKKIFEAITFKLEDVLMSTYFFYWNDTFNKEYDNHNNHWHPSDTNFRFGRCHTLNISNEHAHFSGIEIYLRVNSTLFFHTPGMFKKAQMENQHQHQSVIKLGNHYEFNLKYEYWDFRRKLHDYDGIPCMNEIGYSKDFCTSREIEQYSLENFGCITPFGLNKTKICNNTTNAEKAMKIYWDSMSSANYNSCFNPCSSFSITSPTPTVTSRETKKNAVVQLTFEQYKVIKIYESYYIYSELSLIAEIGGYVGLFLGISVNQVTILMDFILSKLEHLYQHLKS